MRTKILLVEDERIVAEDIRATLESCGYSVTGIAASSQDALELIRCARPDVVLMDIILRGSVDGIETARSIRQLFGLPVVFLTSHADQATLRRATLTEPFGYLLKPFEDRELFSAVELALHRHRAERRIEEDQRWLSTILESLGHGVIAADSMGVVRLANHAAGRILGWPAAAMTGLDLAALYTPFDSNSGAPLEIPSLADLMLKPGIDSPRRFCRLRRRDSSLVDVVETVSAISDNNSTVAGTVVVFHELEARP